MALPGPAMVRVVDPDRVEATADEGADRTARGNGLLHVTPKMIMEFPSVNGLDRQ
jgi:hypothetical protein